MSKIWGWLKKYWKWLVFPIGIFGAALDWFFWRRVPLEDDIAIITDTAVDQVVKDTHNAIDVKGKALKELEQQHGRKLAFMTKEQRAEFEEVKKQPIDEVATWIDGL